MPIHPLGTILTTSADSGEGVILTEYKRGKPDGAVMFPGNCPFVIVSYLPQERYLLAPLATMPKAASFFSVSHDASMNVVDPSKLSVDPKVYRYLTGSDLPNARLV